MNRRGVYSPLGKYLKNCNKDKITLTFEDIEKIIGDKLPPSAYEYRAWWGNNAKGHTHANQWLDNRYRVEKVVLGEYVTFIKEM